MSSILDGLMPALWLSEKESRILVKASKDHMPGDRETVPFYSPEDICAAEAEMQKRVAELERKATIYDTLHTIAKSRGFDCVTDAVMQAASVAVPDFAPVAHRLALELECLLLSCTDNAAVSKWWDSAHEALEQWRAMVATPQPAVAEPVMFNGLTETETSATASVAGLRCLAENCEAHPELHGGRPMSLRECMEAEEKPAPLKVPSDEVLRKIAVRSGPLEAMHAMQKFGVMFDMDGLRRFVEDVLAEVQKGGE